MTGVLIILIMGVLLTLMVLSHLPKKKAPPQCPMCQINKPAPAPHKSIVGSIALLIVLIIVLAYARQHL